MSINSADSTLEFIVPEISSTEKISPEQQLEEEAPLPEAEEGTKAMHNSCENASIAFSQLMCNSYLFIYMLLNKIFGYYSFIYIID